jgi:hypothetical protein
MITYMDRKAIWDELTRAQSDDGFAHLDTITPDGDHKISLDISTRDFQSLMHMEFVPTTPSRIQPAMPPLRQM